MLAKVYFNWVWFIEILELLRLFRWLTRLIGFLVGIWRDWSAGFKSEQLMRSWILCHFSAFLGEYEDRYSICELWIQLEKMRLLPKSGPAGTGGIVFWPYHILSSNVWWSHCRTWWTLRLCSCRSTDTSLRCIQKLTSYASPSLVGCRSSMDHLESTGGWRERTCPRLRGVSCLWLGRSWLSCMKCTSSTFGSMLSMWGSGKKCIALERLVAGSSRRTWWSRRGGRRYRLLCLELCLWLGQAWDSLCICRPWVLFALIQCERSRWSSWQL